MNISASCFASADELLDRSTSICVVSAEMMQPWSPQYCGIEAESTAKGISQKCQAAPRGRMASAHVENVDIAPRVVVPQASNPLSGAVYLPVGSFRRLFT